MRTGQWDSELVEPARPAAAVLPPCVDPGAVVGPLLPEVAADLGVAPDLPVIAVGSHDTASAVVGVPAARDDASAYISSGTWGLVGLELDEPVLTEDGPRGQLHQRGRRRRHGSASSPT